jgi:hypothetical protein
MLLNLRLPHGPFNAAVREGTVGEKLGRILEETKPEAVYFTEDDGNRAVVMVVNVDDSSQVPALAEPWFLNFDADCRIRIAMTPDDLQQSGIDDIGRKWG